MEEPGRLRIPPLQPDRDLPVQTCTGPGEKCSDHTAMAEPELVPTGPGTVDRHTQNPEIATGSFNVPIGRSSSSDTGQQSTDGRLEAIRSSLGEQGLSSAARDLIIAGNRSTTHAAYKSAWNIWKNWCSTRNINPVSSDLNSVLEFLTHQFHEGKSASTIGVYRSMLSSTLGITLPVNERLGQHPQVCQLMAGVYNCRPPTPRYSNTWNPDGVLEYLKSTPVLDLLELSKKLVTLLALTTLRRCSELASISLNSISFSSQGTSFILLKPLKAQHSGPMKSITVGEWPTDIRICPVATMKEYIAICKPLRTISNSDRLFITTTKPHVPVSTATIGRWIKSTLQKSGVDTRVFSAHSTRGAAASKAAAKGTNIQSILDRGHWTKESTFARFYCRTVPDSAVEQSVLSL